jgi:hypothetical protein
MRWPLCWPLKLLLLEKLKLEEDVKDIPEGLLLLVDMVVVMIGYKCSVSCPEMLLPCYGAAECRSSDPVACESLGIYANATVFVPSAERRHLHRHISTRSGSCLLFFSSPLTSPDGQERVSGCAQLVLHKRVGVQLESPPLCWFLHFHTCIHLAEKLGKPREASSPLVMHFAVQEALGSIQCGNILYMFPSFF